MALTRPRAYQIFDLDYKQAVRVVALTNVILSGGAPNAVDGVNLSLNDRILVIGQTNPIQNGIYYVTALGTGANGTWARSIDSDTTGELEGGTVIMVTEGSTYADTQWKLTTDDPIIIGTTALTFVQNYLANSISYGQTSFAIAAANANATISVAGTSNVAVFATTGAFVTGVVSATGNIISSSNISGNYLLGNVFFATGITASKIYNGLSEVNVGTANGAANISIGGTSNVAVFSATGLAITGDLSVTGNATLSGNILGDRLQNGTTSIDIQTASGNANISVSGTSNVAVFTTGGQNINGALSASGNITGSSIFAVSNGQGTNFSVGDDAWIGDINQADTISLRGKQNAANAYIVFGNANTNRLGRAGTGPLTYSDAFSATGNVTGGNLVTTGTISATGNISGNYFVGNGSQLTGILTGNSFGIITVSGQSNVVADQATDTLTLVAGSGIAITTDAGNDSVTISQVATDSIFATGGNMGTVDEAVTVSEDLGTVTSAATVEYDLGTLTTGGILTPSFLLLPSKTVSELSSLTPNPAGQFVYCSNESGGAVPAFSDGTNWRRVTDRAIVS